jgi:hypothetical protein
MYVKRKVSPEKLSIAVVFHVCGQHHYPIIMNHPHILKDCQKNSNNTGNLVGPILNNAYFRRLYLFVQILAGQFRVYWRFGKAKRGAQRKAKAFLFNDFRRPVDVLQCTVSL